MRRTHVKEPQQIRICCVWCFRFAPRDRGHVLDRIVRLFPQGCIADISRETNVAHQRPIDIGCLVLALEIIDAAAGCQHQRGSLADAHHRCSRGIPEATTKPDTLSSCVRTCHDSLVRLGLLQVHPHDLTDVWHYGMRILGREVQESCATDRTRARDITKGRETVSLAVRWESGLESASER